MKQHHKEFGVRWLLRRLNACPNTYYHYLKYRKADYYTKIAPAQAKIGKTA